MHLCKEPKRNQLKSLVNKITLNACKKCYQAQVHVGNKSKKNTFTQLLWAKHVQCVCMYICVNTVYRENTKRHKSINRKLRVA